MLDFILLASGLAFSFGPRTPTVGAAFQNACLSTGARIRRC